MTPETAAPWILHNFDRTWWVSGRTFSWTFLSPPSLPLHQRASIFHCWTIVYCWPGIGPRFWWTPCRPQVGAWRHSLHSYSTVPSHSCSLLAGFQSHWLPYRTSLAKFPECWRWGRWVASLEPRYGLRSDTNSSRPSNFLYSSSGGVRSHLWLGFAIFGRRSPWILTYYLSWRCLPASLSSHRARCTLE